MEGTTDKGLQNEQEGRHVEEEVEGHSTQVARGNTRRNRTTGLSYRRPNRDYDHEKTISWTKEMNKKLYRMYLQAKPEKRGYTKRLKGIWDRNNTGFKEMSDRHLDEQVRNITKRKLSSDEEIKLIESEEIETEDTRLNLRKDINNDTQQPVNQPAEPHQHHHIEQPGEHQEIENEIRENTVSDEEFELKVKS